MNDIVKYYTKISVVIVLSIAFFGNLFNTDVALIMASVLNLFIPYIIIKPFYFNINYKYILALFGACSWASLSFIIAYNWFYDLSLVTNSVLSYLIIFGISIIPGFINAFMAFSLLLDLRPKRKEDIENFPYITILIAAFNEEENIISTIESIEKQNYPGKFKVIVINDGSTDNTSLKVKSIIGKYSWLDFIDNNKNKGKSSALNDGLQLVDSELTVTIDADCYLFKDALKNIVQRYLSDPPNTVAVAGAVLVRNSRKNLITKIQEWDYFHGIAAVKRIQSLYHGTLVAQGAFSIYKTEVLHDLKGWPHCVGEDIVLTWSILKKGYRVGFAEDACLFTNAPETVSQFIKQRQRWSRGLVEAFKENWQLLFLPRLTTLFIWWNLLFFYLDVIYTFAFIPGIIMAFFGYYYIAGPMTLIVLPMALMINYVMFDIQVNMFNSQGLKVRKNIPGFIGYVFFYSMILQPACVMGYLKELIMPRIKSWGTK